MTSECNVTAQKQSFWSLLNEDAKIQIPNYQREYAQGRNNRRAKLIREGFVESLHNSLEKNDELELDFIFGGKDTGDAGDAFNPVDGQQRLTILFLLHWYIFVRAGRTAELKKIEENFRYKTRTTSETFCKEICNEDWEFRFEIGEKENGQISLQIMDRPWFTGAMNSDPTVKSMLVVIDCIHKRFSEDIDINYEQVSDILISDNCPITFFCLNLNDALGITSGIRDLYIKMNARGLALTDFELFKANLQKKDSSGGRLDLLAEYFKKIKKDDNAERVKLIGKFNNEYTNFFFNLVDNGEVKSSNNDGSQSQMFDISMMNFINEVFRMNYFSAISELGAAQKDYRSYNEVFREMSGREFISFIEKNGKYYNEKIRLKHATEKADEKIKNAIVGAFDNIVKLLDMFSQCSSGNLNFDQGDENANGKCQYLLADMLKEYATDPQDNRALPFRESLIRMGLFEFILKFGIPENDEQKNAFNTWSRFVWKIDKNSEFKNFDEAIETLKGYKKIIDSIPGEKYTSNSVIDAIARIEKIDNNGKIVAGPARMQLAEEIEKAKLIQSKDRWADVIKEAEDYYNDSGQIWFLLELSKIDGQCDIEMFRKAFDYSKELFEVVDFPKRGKVRCICKVRSDYFERALLAMPKFDVEDHLDSMGKSTGQTKKFVGADFSRHVSHQYCESNDDREKTKYRITMALLQEIVDMPTKISDMSKWLQDYFQHGNSSVDWKNVFIQNDLFDKSIDGLSFKNTFEPDVGEENSYTAVYTNVARRTDSGELHSFSMASKLRDEGKSIRYYTSSNEEYITDGFPNRYFEVNNTGIEIGYMRGEFYSRINGNISKIGNENDVVEFVSKQKNN